MKGTLLKIFVIIFTLATLALTAQSLFHIMATSAPDFSLLWISTHDLVRHQNPYTNPSLFTINAYPPSTFLLYIPLAVIPRQCAQAIFTLLSFLAIPGILFLSLRIASKEVSIFQFLLFLSLTLLSFPTKFTLGMGQVNLIAIFVTLCSFFFYKKKKLEISGMLFGLACLLKPILVLLLFFFIIKKSWKVVLYATFIPISATFVTIFVFGTNPFVYWITKVAPQLGGTVGAGVYYNQGLLGFISRITTNLVARAYINKVLSFILVAFTSVQIFKKRNDENVQFALLITTLLLIDTQSWQHHFVWLIFPFIVLVQHALKMKKTWFWGLLIAAYVLVSWNFKNPQNFSSFPQSLILSNTFYGGVIVYALTLFLLSLFNHDVSDVRSV